MRSQQLERRLRRLERQRGLAKPTGPRRRTLREQWALPEQETPAEWSERTRAACLAAREELRRLLNAAERDDAREEGVAGGVATTSAGDTFPLRPRKNEPTGDK